MGETIKRNHYQNKGSALVLVVIAMVILLLLGVALLTITYGVRLQAIKLKNETVAMLAAEAGYERGIFWMSQAPDVLTGLSNNDPPGSSGTINLSASSCNYTVSFYNYIGSKPIFRILSTGTCGASSRTVDVYVMQAVTGWDMGMCQIPSGGATTNPVYFGNGEIVNIKVHINNDKTNPASDRDIYISGSPTFLQQVQMGESRYNGQTDKYSPVMNLFSGGIIFDQPDVKITNKAAIDAKLARFQASTKAQYQYTPVAAEIANSDISASFSRLSAVQLEFFVDGGVGKILVRNNCTVIGTRRGTDHTWDYMKASNNANAYVPYDIYAYHYHDDTDPFDPPRTVLVSDTYVTQTFAGKQSEPCGQIYVNGNVILGSQTYDSLLVGGKLTIVATGNIWIADSIRVYGNHDADGLATSDNPNALGLIARGVIKVIDPGLSSYPANAGNSYPGPAPALVHNRLIPTKTYNYIPVANSAGGNLNNRILPDPTVVEAAVTVGGGGWGAENVARNGYGDRKTVHNPQDVLILRGTICEATRGVVGILNQDGYIKQYSLDARLLEGVLPGNIWFGGKYVPAPAGWHDYRL